MTSDVTSKESLQALADQIAEKEDHIDLLVCNAGISGPKAIPDLDDAQALKDRLWSKEDFSGWTDVFTTNVSAVYFTSVVFLPLLSKSPGGSIITISSMSGLTKDAQGHFAYNAAKGATVHLTKLMSNEFMSVGLRVNSIGWSPFHWLPARACQWLNRNIRSTWLFPE